MKTTDYRLDALSRAETEFSIGPLPSSPHGTVLIVAFRGEASNRPEHFGTFALMRAMIAGGIAAWSPNAVVLDLRELVYEWGDPMAEVLGAGNRLPFVAVVSERNRPGLTSLVEAEMFAQPQDLLHESIEDAIKSVDQAIRARREARTNLFPPDNPWATEGTEMAPVQPVIHRDPDIMGGTPVFIGTRVPVRALIDYLAAGDPLDEFLNDFPSVSREQAIAALAQAHGLLIAHANPAR